MWMEVRLYATLRRYAPSASEGVLAVDAPEGATAADVIAKLKLDPNEVHILMVNGVISPPERVLADGDRLGLFPPIGGG